MKNKNYFNEECLFFSYLIPDEEFENLKLQDESPQIPTHKFNWKIFKGLYNSKYFKTKFHLVSIRPISDYPRSEIKKNKANKWDTQYGTIHEMWFSNYPVIKQLSIF